jgi:hypothetical protein
VETDGEFGSNTEKALIAAVEEWPQPGRARPAGRFHGARGELGVERIDYALAAAQIAQVVQKTIAGRARILLEKK